MIFTPQILSSSRSYNNFEHDSIILIGWMKYYYEITSGKVITVYDGNAVLCSYSKSESARQSIW